VARSATGDFYNIHGVIKDFTTRPAHILVERKTPSRHMAAWRPGLGRGLRPARRALGKLFHLQRCGFLAARWHQRLWASPQSWLRER